MEPHGCLADAEMLAGCHKTKEIKETFHTSHVSETTKQTSPWFITTGFLQHGYQVSREDGSQPDWGLGRNSANSIWLELVKAATSE